MYELIVTLVSTEDDDEGSYPVTEVYRVEFDSVRRAMDAISTMQKMPGARHWERLRSNRTGV